MLVQLTHVINKNGFRVNKMEWRIYLFANILCFPLND